MIELSKERIEKILNEETAKTVELKTILRSIYIRYMRMYEKYFSDIDALNNDTISELRKYNEETKSLVRYYYLDIPQDISEGIKELENKSVAKLLGPKWRKYLSDSYEAFKEDYDDEYKNEKALKEAFTKQAMEEFYDTMDDVFREGFGTVSQNAKDFSNGLTGLLFGTGK